MFYNEERVFLSGATPQVFYYAANDIYDPYPPTGGHEAFGWYHWIRHFRYFRVHASAIKVTFMNQQSNDTGGVNVFLTYNKEGQADLQTWIVQSTGVARQGIRENLLIKTKRLSFWNASKPERDYTKSLTYRRKTKTVFGVKNLDDINFQGTLDVASPPATHRWQWTLGASAADLVTTINVLYKVFITYYVELFAPQVLTDMGTAP